MRLPKVLAFLLIYAFSLDQQPHPATAQQHLCQPLDTLHAFRDVAPSIRYNTTSLIGSLQSNANFSTHTFTQQMMKTMSHFYGD